MLIQFSAQVIHQCLVCAGQYLASHLNLIKLVSSKHLTQVHLKILSRTLQNLASRVMTKWKHFGSKISHAYITDAIVRQQNREAYSWEYMAATQRNKRRELTIRPNISKFSKRGQMVQKFPGKSSRKSGNCWISEMRTIQVKIPEFPDEVKWSGNFQEIVFWKFEYTSRGCPLFSECMQIPDFLHSAS